MFIKSLVLVSTCSEMWGKAQTMTATVVDRAVHSAKGVGLSSMGGREVSECVKIGVDTIVWTFTTLRTMYSFLFSLFCSLR